MILKFVDEINPIVTWSFFGGITIKEREEPRKEWGQM
jgi:hypothetical protein